MKNNLLIITISIFLYLVSFNVYATGKDVEAIFKQSYNVELVTKVINNEKVTLEIDDLSLELSSSDNNIKVVLIKASENANDYAKTFTNNLKNYYLTFYKNDKKIETSNISIQIKNLYKNLNVYNNHGELIEKTNEIISLTGNDYFISLTDIIDIENSLYKVTDINSTVDKLKDININDETVVDIYNSLDQKIKNTDKLGTNYKVIINNAGLKQIYQIVVIGDTTGDAFISLNDVTRLYHHYKNIKKMDDIYVLAGDVTQNDEISLNDVTKIYHYYKGIIPNL